MKTWMIKFTVALAFATLLLSGSARAQSDDDGCSLATLKGDYAFTVSGTIWTGPSNSIAVQRAGIAMTHFDGNGGLKQVDFVNSSPNMPVPPGPPLIPPSDPVTGFHNGETGSYIVYKDCTGTFTINDPDFEGTSTPGPQITANFVISHGGRAIHTVVTSLVVHTPAGPQTVPALIRSDGYKLGKIEDSWN